MNWVNGLLAEKMNWVNGLMNKPVPQVNTRSKDLFMSIILK